jgi:thiol-disulfide isomerase/thioredoxin
VTAIPDLKNIDNDFNGKGLKVVAVYVKEPAARVVKFKSRYGLPYDVLLDLNGDTAYLYRISGVPTFIVLDARGDILYEGHEIPFDIITRITNRT